jgi:protein-S-isoprenylcysteine O-methyltransferase Ste14
MEHLIIFGILSLPIIFISWRTLFNVKSHGFYRFFGWEGILWLLVSNFRFWFYDPFSLEQIVSWILLLVGSYYVIAGVIQMKTKGKATKNRDEKALYQFEKTSELIDTGIFKYIRHPLYSSLIFLTWGIFFKNPNVVSLVVSVISSIFFIITAILDEKECIAYFGNQYRDYMKRSKRFIPFLI